MIRIQNEKFFNVHVTLPNSFLGMSEQSCRVLIWKLYAHIRNFALMSFSMVQCEIIVFIYT